MTMLGLKKTLLSSALLLPCATAYKVQNSTNGIQWGPCAHDKGEYPLPVVCGNVSVPLDYTDESSGEKLVLQLTRIAAVAGPSKGSIFFNFGGPGGEAQQTLAGFGALGMNITGGEYDLVAFDPRGTGTTIPFSCYATPEEAVVAGLQYPVTASNSSDVALGRIWAQSTIKASACAGAPSNKTGELIGTAFTARDFISVVDVLEEDGMLRYIGISYGTMLGATIAAMFPDRIDRLALDAAVNPHEYTSGIQTQSISDVDELFSAFIKECAASPDSCPLARGNTTAAALETKLYDFFHELKYEPIALPPYVIDYSLVKAVIFSMLYWPVQWPVLALALDSLLTGNLDPLKDSSLFGGDAPEATALSQDAFYGIWCGDASLRTTKLDDLRPAVDAMTDASRLAGDTRVQHFVQCAQWPFAAKERYDGDFTAKTHHPILLVGNTLDPITPLAAAHNLSAGFEGSVVLQNDGYGHSTLAQSSECTNNAVREYFQTGKLPEPGTVCEVDDKVIFKPTNSTATAPVPNALRRRFF